MRSYLVCIVATILFGCAGAVTKDGELLRRDHYVSLTSTAPGMAGREARLYVREVVLGQSTMVPGRNHVVLMVHGSGAISYLFDTSPAGYSWMAHLARAGLDVFAVDLTGYGRSTRPPQMDDPCNVPKELQVQLIPNLLTSTCSPSHSTYVTSMVSDWNDIDAVVEYLRTLRHTEKVSLVGWSLGGPRVAGYAARNPAKVERLFALAPDYERDYPSDIPSVLPAPDGIMRVSTSGTASRASWSSQIGCANQYDEAFSMALWGALLATETADGKWSGVRRTPMVPVGGFNQSIAAAMKVPFAVATGQFDNVIPPERVRELYDDLGSSEKVFVDLACSSHNAMWERNRQMLFDASAAWLTTGEVNGVKRGVVKLGY